MDRSRITAAVANVTFLPSPAALGSTDADVVVVDLTRPGVLDAIGSVNGEVIGFANHVERELMEAANAAGCDRVMARSAFFSRVGELLA